MHLTKALRDLLEREWDAPEDTEFILEAVEEYYANGHYPEEKKEHQEKVNSAMKVFDSFISELTK